MCCSVFVSWGLIVSLILQCFPLSLISSAVVSGVQSRPLKLCPQAIWSQYDIVFCSIWPCGHLTVFMFCSMWIYLKYSIFLKTALSIFSRSQGQSLPSCLLIVYLFVVTFCSTHQACSLVVSCILIPDLTFPLVWVLTLISAPVGNSARLLITLVL